MENQQQAPVNSQRTASVTRSTLIVMGGMAVALVAGLIRQPIIASRFGTSAALDAYGAANGIPELLVMMLSGGALAFAFIPIYSEKIKQAENADANRLFSQVVNNVFLLTAAASLVVVLLAPLFVRSWWGIGPNFDPETQRLTVQLMRILLISTLIFSVSSLITGTLQTHQHFLLPAIAPVLYTGGIIFGAVVLSPAMGVHGLAWGAVIGALMHLLVQVPGLLIYRVRWSPGLGWKNPALQKVGILMLPRAIDLLMARASIDWINSNLGSGMGTGRIAALRYGYQLMNMPWTLIGTAIGIAVFPTLAQIAAGEDTKSQRRALSGSLRAVLVLALPAAAGLLVLGRPIIQLLFERGEFTAQSTELVFYALQFYVVALISQSVLEVVVRAFAAQKDTLTPLIVSFFTTTLNVILAIWLSSPKRLSHGGLALANGIAVGIEATIGLIIIHLRWNLLDGRQIGLDTLRALAASVLMGITVILYLWLVSPDPFVAVVGGGMIGLAVYFGAALLLGIDDIRTIPATVIAGVFSKRTD
ncbi:MAG: murein biosynthesis integral membrane protein MurJ [Anaerolineae bacterium]|nr:murein biosynthesis integral membrane protein MurJ [Anaerolineae bacterium]